MPNLNYTLLSGTKDCGAIEGTTITSLKTQDGVWHRYANAAKTCFESPSHMKELALAKHYDEQEPRKRVSTIIAVTSSIVEGNLVITTTLGPLAVAALFAVAAGLAYAWFHGGDKGTDRETSSKKRLLSKRGDTFQLAWNDEGQTAANLGDDSYDEAAIKDCGQAISNAGAIGGDCDITFTLDDNSEQYTKIGIGENGNYPQDP